MSQRGLEALLRPKSIAVIGASMKPQRAGYLMMRNLLAGGFNGLGDILECLLVAGQIGRESAFVTDGCG